MPDVEICCIQCQENFIFSEREQEDFYRRNMQPPQRCSACRPSRKKASAIQNGETPNRFEIACDNCGKHDFVPFAPKVGRSVLCSACFAASRARTRHA